MKNFGRYISLFVLVIMLLPNFVLAIELKKVESQPANDPFYSEQWYLDKINISEAWKKTTGSGKVVVAVIDSGVNIDHPDLINNIWQNTDEISGDKIDNDRNGYVDDVNGWDFIQNSSDPRPKKSDNVNFSKQGFNHGTVVAGVIAAEGNNEAGIAGISWHSKIMSLRVLNSQGQGDISAVVEAIDYAINNGASIINLSFAGNKNDQRLEEAIKRAGKKNVVVVVAAGNEGFSGLDTQFLAYEKEYKGGIKIAVGNVDGDKYSEIVTAPMEDSLPLINIFDTQGKLKKKFYAYNKKFRGGVNVAVGDIDGDGIDEIITGSKLNDKPYVKIFDNYGEQQAVFLADDKDFFGGINVASGDINGDNIDEIVVGLGAGGKPKVKIFDKLGKLQGEFLAYASNFLGGVNVVIGDVDGDGIGEIITGAGYTGGPHVRIFNNQGQLKNQFFAFEENLRGGVTVASGKILSNDSSEIVVGISKGGSSYVRIKTLSRRKTGINLSKFPLYPACYQNDNLITVASADVNNLKSVFSNYGDECVDFATPGEFFFGLTTASDKYYGGYWSGTSLATPVVTGIIALIKSIKATSSPQEIIDILTNSVLTVKIKNNEIKYGVIDASKAIDLAIKHKTNP